MAETIVDKLIRIATEEWEFFGKNMLDIHRHLTHQGHTETQNHYYQRVGDYWRIGVGDESLNGLNTDQPWSAAFISFVQHQAWAGTRFVYSARDSTYIKQAKRDRIHGNTAAGYWAFPLNERKPLVGDLVGFPRQSGITYANMLNRGSFISHCDLVVAVRDGEIDVIGGNVLDSVTKKTLAVDDQGHLHPGHYGYFVVLRQRFVDPG